MMGDAMRRQIFAESFTFSLPSPSAVLDVPFVADNAQFIISTNQNRGLTAAAALPMLLPS